VNLEKVKDGAKTIRAQIVWRWIGEAGRDDGNDQLGRVKRGQGLYVQRLDLRVAK
jgi:hypothetical protein